MKIKKILAIFLFCSFFINSIILVSSKDTNIQNETLPIDNVTSRLYRGFLADDNIVQQVREEFLDKKKDVFKSIDSLKKYFLYPKDFERSRDYVSDFYETLADDKKFKRRITNFARSK